MKLDITNDERDNIVMGLQIRICVIETGRPGIRSNDAINMGQPKLVQALTEGQRSLIAQHEALIRKMLMAR